MNGDEMLGGVTRASGRTIRVCFSPLALVTPSRDDRLWQKNAGRWLGRPGQLQSVRAGEGWWQWRRAFLVPRQLVRAIASTSRCINTTKLHSLKKLPLSQSTQAQRALARGP